MLTQVTWWGTPPPADASDAADARGLSLATGQSKGLAQLDAVLARSTAVVFAVTGAGDQLLKDGMNRLFAAALGHGCAPVIFCDVADVDAVYTEIKHLPYASRLVLRTPPSVDKMFGEMSPSPRRRWLRNDKIKGPSKFSPEDRLLLERAFADCIEVTLTRLDGGASGDVYQASVRLRDSKIGPHPLPFFVKLERYTKAKREIDNYLDCTTLFIPFYARPNIDQSRCLLGAERGVIVGNFVEHSDSLGDLVARGSAQQAIGSLFDDALRGWRTQAYATPAHQVTRSIAKSLGGAVPAGYSNSAWERAETQARAARAYGATMTAAELAALLDGLAPRLHRLCLSHGDLHDRNVRVRNNQAILIDFAAVATAPLVADPAALDAALCLDAQASSFEHWRDTVTDLYLPANVFSLPSPPPPGALMPHLVHAVRQVRRHGLADAFSAEEYATALAIFLLRHALREPREKEQPNRRAVVFFLAERLARDLAAAKASIAA